jgi:hypothetical protein
MTFVSPLEENQMSDRAAQRGYPSEYRSGGKSTARTTSRHSIREQELLPAHVDLPHMRLTSHRMNSAFSSL